jgi:hypothetical protein
MPILVEADASDDLSQGDLLKDVVLCFTGDDNEPRTNRNALALVVTRDCGVENDNLIVVARVHNRAATLPRRDPKGVTAEKHYETIHRMFEQLKDGTGRPDSFYLGTLPEGIDRLAAQLDQLSTIKLPDERKSWIAAHRVARLSDTFKRSLPVRLFGAYARIGHSDIDWLCTPDLETVVAAGKEYEGELQSSVSRCRYELEQSKSYGKATNPSVEKALADAEAKAADFSREFQPLANELDRRKT